MDYNNIFNPICEVSEISPFLQVDDIPSLSLPNTTITLNSHPMQPGAINNNNHIKEKLNMHLKRRLQETITSTSSCETTSFIPPVNNAPENNTNLIGEINSPIVIGPQFSMPQNNQQQQKKKPRQRKSKKQKSTEKNSQHNIPSTSQLSQPSSSIVDPDDILYPGPQIAAAEFEARDNEKKITELLTNVLNQKKLALLRNPEVLQCLRMASEKHREKMNASNTQFSSS